MDALPVGTIQMVSRFLQEETRETAGGVERRCGESWLADRTSCAGSSDLQYRTRQRSHMPKITVSLSFATWRQHADCRGRAEEV